MFLFSLFRSRSVDWRDKSFQKIQESTNEHDASRRENEAQSESEKQKKRMEKKDRRSIINQIVDSTAKGNVRTTIRV